MSKYVSKQDKELKVTAEKVKDDTEIKTPYGPALVTKGNYILTFDDGSQVGTTKTDLDAQYKPAK